MDDFQKKIRNNSSLDNKTKFAVLKSKYKFFVKFYATDKSLKKQYVNKLFSFGCNSFDECKSIIDKFRKTNYINKIFYVAGSQYFIVNNSISTNIELSFQNNQVVLYKIIEKNGNLYIIKNKFVVVNY